ncbi:hypothetical protein [Blautia sp. MSJ-19]|uniref:hypothetical protein n=1 Tax=Blautia sp. MSJ-19 TaxID=2841517 RepID=UPI001C0F2212|nr:hypothetical protein [Blautia sp. MSJ-19]MBU5481398.1 hypothetical protein [Blautia sp. MSJ-19]
MPEKYSSVKEFHNRNRNLWQFVLLLVVLVAITVTLVVTCLYQFIHHSDYEINLYQGLVSADQKTSSVSGTRTADSSVKELTGKQAKAFDFKVADDENVWSTNTSIELFHTSYQNSKGEITVQSADSKEVVAPGTEGNYTFSLKNASKLDSNYQVWLEAGVNVSSSGIPIEFRMAGSDGWVDDKGEWLSANELNKITERKNLYSGKSTEYTLYWRWAFEREEDEADTSYGNLAVDAGNVSTGNLEVSQAVSYKVTLHTLASEGLIENSTTDSPTVTPGTSTITPAQNKNIGTAGNSSSVNEKQATAKDTTAITKKATKTGDDTPVWGWILLLGAAGTIAAGIGYHRRKDK